MVYYRKLLINLLVPARETIEIRATMGVVALGTSLAPYAPFSGCACELKLLLHVFFHPVSGKRSDV
jgi:hypothetical protein